MCECATKKCEYWCDKQRNTPDLELYHKFRTTNTKSHNESIDFIHICRKRVLIMSAALHAPPPECETPGSRLAVLFSEKLCVCGGGREPLWLSELLSVLRIGDGVQGTSRLRVSLTPSPPASAPSHPPMFPLFRHSENTTEVSHTANAKYRYVSAISTAT